MTSTRRMKFRDLKLIQELRRDPDVDVRHGRINKLLHEMAYTYCRLWRRIRRKILNDKKKDRQWQRFQ